MVFRFSSKTLLAAALVFCVATGLPSFSSPAKAYDSDEALERDGYLCTRQIARSERQYGIPLRLLSAMAATESGRMHKGLGVRVPWPWTINAEGKPYLFHTKREAVIAVEKLQKQGIKSIDVGCMQVNLYHHPNAFANLSQAFEPSFNVDYAARFLRSNYQEANSWREAVGHYHSRTPDYAARYTNLVYNQWYGISGKVVADRRQKYESKYRSYVRVEGSGKEVDLTAAAAKERSVARVAPTPKTIKIASREPDKKYYEMNVIRPASSAGEVETAATIDVDAESNPIVMDESSARKTDDNGRKGFTSPKIVFIGAEGNTDDKREDSRIIRFVQ